MTLSSAWEAEPADPPRHGVTSTAQDRPCWCGSTTGVRIYLTGPACPEHTPAQLAGHPEPPDPAASRPAPSPPRPPRVYGHATTDPRPNMIPASRFADGLARHACPTCLDARSDVPLEQQNPIRHKGEHWT